MDTNQNKPQGYLNVSTNVKNKFLCCISKTVTTATDVGNIKIDSKDREMRNKVIQDTDDEINMIIDAILVEEKKEMKDKEEEIPVSPDIQ